jgi:hypothetical protein
MTDCATTLKLTTNYLKEIIMTSRVSTEQLQAIVNRINTMTNSPLKPYETVEGKYVAQIGNYHLSQAYGGFALHRMQSDGGGIVDVLGRGHMPKREIAELMYAWIRGFDQAKSV